MPHRPKRRSTNVGLGPARHGETLFLQGDVAPGSAKDPRRAAIAERYCVIAMAGDQLGDFSDLFNARTLSVPDRRRAATQRAVRQPLGPMAGSCLSNPVYGPSLRGNFDEVFPADTRWSDPARGTNNALGPQPDGRARRQGASRRLLRQSRHRHPDPGRQQHPGRHGSDAAVRERHARHRPLSL